jgi:hypothetical protein
MAAEYFTMYQRNPIDHVLVAPTGVYAVETKARRKRKTPKGKRDHEVVFDGEKLQFPEATDLSSLHQAGQQADRLGCAPF